MKVKEVKVILNTQGRKFEGKVSVVVYSKDTSETELKRRAKNIFFEEIEKTEFVIEE